MVSKSLDDLLFEQLQDAFSAENQLLVAMADMALAATSKHVKVTFELHLEETKGQIERLHDVCNLIGCNPYSRRCEAMEGLVEEAEEAIDMVADGEVRDMALMIAAQKIEHYEIALYTGLCMLARQLGLVEAAEILNESLEEESVTDHKLNLLSERQVNVQMAGF